MFINGTISFTLSYSSKVIFFSFSSYIIILSCLIDVLIKNFQTLELAEKAIVRVEGLAKELGADSLLKELEKPKMLLKEFRNTTNNTLKAVQSGIANL